MESVHRVSVAVVDGYAPVEDDDQDLESMAQSVPVKAKSTSPTSVEIVDKATAAAAHEAPAQVHSSTELLEAITGSSADAPLCMNCGTKMRPAGSCFVCEGCGSTSGCS